VVATNLNSLFTGFLKLSILAGGALYSGLVLMSYRTDGPQPRPVFHPQDPGRSAERLLLWLGVKVLVLGVQIAVRTFGMLTEASAEIGDWYLDQRAPEVQASFRARFREQVLARTALHLRP
jgi:hypothetical protein